MFKRISIVGIETPSERCANTEPRRLGCAAWILSQTRSFSLMPMEAAVVMAAARWAALTVGSREARALASSIMRLVALPSQRLTILAGVARTVKLAARAVRGCTIRLIVSAPQRCLPSPIRGYSVLRCLSSAAVTSLTALIRIAAARRSPGTRARGPAAPAGIANGGSGLGKCGHVQGASTRPIWVFSQLSSQLRLPSKFRNRGCDTQSGA
jgi:hypothetical protein